MPRLQVGSFFLFSLAAWLQNASCQDPCRDDPNAMRQLSWSMMCADVGYEKEGFSCDGVGFNCPVTCGLCDVMFPAPVCTEEEIYTKKENLAQFLRDLEICPDCAAPPLGSETVYVRKNSSAHLNQPTFGYTSLHPQDPCLMSGITCDRCGDVNMVLIGFPPVPITGAVTPSVFKLPRLNGLAVQSSTPFAGGPYLPAEAWKNLTELDFTFLQGSINGSVPLLYELPVLHIVRIINCNLYGDVNNIFGGPLMSMTVVHNSPDREAQLDRRELSPRVCDMKLNKFLDIQFGGLIGSLPPCLAEVRSFLFVTLVGNDLTGDVSPMLYSPFLIAATAIGSQFTGTLPAALSGAFLLTALNFPSNQISGTIPTLNRSGVVTFLNFPGNKLTGAGGPVVGQGLRILMSHNEFTTVPTGWWSLPGVIEMDLSNNMIETWPAAGVYPRGIFTTEGFPTQCGKAPDLPSFDWPDLLTLRISGNPMDGKDVRDVLGSLAPIPRLRTVEAQDCHLAMDLPMEGTGVMLGSTDAQNCDFTLRFAFPSMSTLLMAGNNIEALRGGPWSLLERVDFSRNNLEYVFPTWFEAGGPLLADFRDNPPLRLEVAPASQCDSTGPRLRADEGAFSSRLAIDPESQECTVLCTVGAITYVDAAVNSSALCHCRAGWYGDGTVCHECKADEWSPVGAQHPTHCPANSGTSGKNRSTSEEECDCDAGFYRVYLPEVACLPCPANTKREAPGARVVSDCVSCSAGRYSLPSDDGGTTECVDCERGSVARGGAGSGCEPCPAGTYKESDSATTCTPCPRGSYQPEVGQESCIPCMGFANTTWRYSALENIYLPHDGAESATNCGCDAGYRPAGTTCVSCMKAEDEGLDCPGGLSGDVVKVLPGYFSDTDISLYRCWGDEARCVGGPPGQSCASGRKGLTCALCQDGKVPSSGGACKECTDGSKVILPFAMLAIVGIAVAIYVAVDTQNRALQSNSAVLMACALSLLITVTQQLGLISAISVSWSEPLKGFFRVLRLLNFDVEVLQPGCIADVSEMSLFLSRMLLIFIGFTIMMLIHVVAVVFVYSGNFRARESSLIGSIGVVGTVFYIAVVATIIGPLQCQHHPNGHWTSQDYQSIECFKSSEHSTMVVISILGLSVPLAYLAAVCRAVWSYPAQVRAGNMAFLKAYGFLFYRFNAERYWYIIVFVLRSLFMALSIVIPEPALCIYVMQLLLLVTFSITMRIFPWRTTRANYLDCVSGIMVLLLLGIALFFVQDIEEESRDRLAWVMMMTLLIMLSAGPLFIGWCIYVRFFRVVKFYEFFLCHHKMGAGAFTRLLKMALRESSKVSREVFVDSDNLENLDSLFGHVRDETEVLVAIASSDLLLRPWCAGELTTAKLSHVKVAVVQMRDFLVPTEDLIENYADHVDTRALTERGLSLEMVQAMLRWFRELPVITMSEVLTPTSVQALVDTLALKSFSAALAIEGRSLKSIAQERRGEPPDVGITSDVENSEAVAAALVLQKMLTQLMSDMGTPMLSDIVLTAGQLEADRSPNMKRLICMFTGSCLESTCFLEQLNVACKRDISTLPVVAEDAFRFPSKDHMLEIHYGGDYKVGQFLLTIFTQIAVHFLANMADRGTLQIAAQTVARRIPKAAATTRDQVNTSASMNTTSSAKGSLRDVTSDAEQLISPSNNSVVQEDRTVQEPLSTVTSATDKKSFAEAFSFDC